MAIRKVLHRDYFHYTNGSTFNQISTASLISNGTEDWTVTYDGVTGGFITSPAGGSEEVLTNYEPVTHPATQVMWDCHINCSAWTTEVSGDNGAGLAFMLNGNAGTFTEGYRLRQANDGIYVDQYNGSTWVNVESFSTTADLDTDYYFRIAYAVAAYKIQDIITIPNFAKGYIHVWRGTSQDVMTYIGKAIIVNGTLTSGPFFGLVKGSGTTFTSKGMGMYRFWDVDTDYEDVTHQMDEDSTLTFAFTRNSDKIVQNYSVSDRVEVWCHESDIENSVERLRLYFDGKIQTAPSVDKSYYQALGFSVELADMHWNGSTVTGATTTALKGILNGHAGLKQVTSSTTSTYVLHNLNVKPSALETNRTVYGKNANIPFKQMMTELGYFFMYLPDGRFIVSDTLIDPSITLNGTSQYLRISDMEFWYDGKQVATQMNDYFDGWTSGPGTAANGTLAGTLGTKARTIVDMHVLDSTRAGYVTGNLKRNYGRNPEIIKLDLIMQHFDIFPGQKIGVALAGIGSAISNWDDGTPANWNTIYMTCTSTHWDSRTGIHEIVLCMNDQDSADSAVQREYPLKKKVSGDILSHLASMEA